MNTQAAVNDFLAQRSLAPVGIHFWTDVVWHVVWGVA